MVYFSNDDAEILATFIKSRISFADDRYTLIVNDSNQILRVRFPEPGPDGILSLKVDHSVRQPLHTEHVSHFVGFSTHTHTHTKNHANPNHFI